MEPESIFLDTTKLKSMGFVTALNSNGPEIRLTERSMLSSEVRLPTCAGIIPVSKFEDKYKTCKCSRLLIDDGIAPVSMLLHSSKNSN